MATEKHSWTKQELWVLSICYKEGLSPEFALRLTNTTDEKSIKMRYLNCLYLDKGHVENALSHVSKMHKEVWEKVEEYYSTKEPIYKNQQNDVTTDRLLVLAIFMSIGSIAYGLSQL